MRSHLLLLQLAHREHGKLRGLMLPAGTESDGYRANI
ncbi:hypothetical protein LINGRAHAP2_LOCUS15785 [Linum grandiflorum]